MFGTFLHKNFEIDTFKPSVLIPVGMHVDQYEKLGDAIKAHAEEIRKEAEKQEKQEEKVCSSCESPCSSCEAEKPKEKTCP